VRITPPRLAEREAACAVSLAVVVSPHAAGNISTRAASSLSHALEGTGDRWHLGVVQCVLSAVSMPRAMRCRTFYRTRTNEDRELTNEHPRHWPLVSAACVRRRENKTSHFGVRYGQGWIRAGFEIRIIFRKRTNGTIPLYQMV
jgi:hypothetical protein